MNSRDFRWMLAGLLIGAAFCAGAGWMLDFHRGVRHSGETLAHEAEPHPGLSNGGHVYLSGAMHAEGAIEIHAGETVTVSQAIITGGGLGPLADQHQIRLVRAGVQPVVVDFFKIAEGQPAPDPVVQPGDTIIVPTKVASF